MRSETHGNARARRLVTGLIGLLLGGCLLPEIDVPPIDPSLVPKESTGGGGGGGVAVACDEGTYNGPLTLQATTATVDGYAGECTVQGNVTVDLDSPALKQLAPLREIKGSLILVGASKAARRTILPGLEVAKVVSVQNASFAHFPALPRLKVVDGLWIAHTQMPVFVGFEALTSAQSIVFSGNNFHTLQGFGKLTKVTSQLDVKENFGLSKLVAFAALKSATSIKIEHSPLGALAFPALVSGGSLHLLHLPSLVDLRLPTLDNVNVLELNDLPSLVAPAKTTLKSLQQLRIMHCVNLDSIDWIPANASLSSLAIICKSGANLLAKVKAWVQASGSPGQVSDQGCP